MAAGETPHAGRAGRAAELLRRAERRPPNRSTFTTRTTPARSSHTIRPAWPPLADTPSGSTAIGSSPARPRKVRRSDRIARTRIAQIKEESKWSPARSQPSAASPAARSRPSSQAPRRPCLRRLLGSECSARVRRGARRLDHRLPHRLRREPDRHGNSMLLPAKLPEYFICSPTDKVAAIQDAAGGNLSITPAT